MTDGSRKKLVVFMPALNEEKTIGAVIDRIPRDPGFPAQVEVVVVDDGSQDATGRTAADKGAVVIRHPYRMGLGRSFAQGLDRALRDGGDIIVSIDADGQFDPADIPLLIRPIVEGQADLVTASRFARKDLVPDMPWLRRWGNRQMSRLVNAATGTTRLTDVSCGFRAFTRQAALHLNLVGAFTYTHESIMDLAAKGFRIVEVPLRVRGVREHGRSRVARNPFLYGVRALLVILRALCYTRPMAFFGTVAVVLFVLGVLQGLFVFGHWLMTHQTTPYRALLTGSSLFLMLAFLVGILALLADMLGRLVNVSERLYTHVKQDRYADGANNEGRQNRTGPEPPAGREAPREPEDASRGRGSGKS